MRVGLLMNCIVVGHVLLLSTAAQFARAADQFVDASGHGGVAETQIANTREQVGGETDPAVMARITADIVDNVYQPLHSEFAKVADRMAIEAVDLCQQRPASSLYKLQYGFAQLVEHYAAIELFRIGPLLEDNRQNRLFYWPDERRVASRQLNTVLSEVAAQEVTAEQLAQKSVAVQGLAALERLLFQSKFQPIENAPQCVLIPLIFSNIALMADELDKGWQSDADIVQSLLYPHPESADFRSPDEVLRSVYTQVKLGLDSVLDNKLQPFLSSNEKRRQTTPLWISQRTVALLTGNIMALDALLLDSGMLSGTEFEKALKIEFNYVNHILRKLKPIMYFKESDGALSADVKVLIHQLAAVLAGVRYTLNSEISVVLQVNAGFNSEDGD